MRGGGVPMMGAVYFNLGGKGGFQRGTSEMSIYRVYMA